jgi:hypothetical protein
VKRADSLLIPFVRELGIEDGVKLAQIKRNWYNLFNKPLSYHMSPLILSKGEILLNVDSPVWLQELNFYREDIIKKMSSYGVKTVRFRLGRISRNKPSALSSQHLAAVKQLTNDERAFVRDIVSKIGDELLRGTVKTALEKSISSGKTKISQK